MPSTLRALLQERIDRLSEDERDVLARAAVEGSVFHREPLAALASDDAASRDGATVLALMRKGFVSPTSAEFAGDDAFRFRHVLLHSAAYESVPKERRARLHVRFADWLEQHGVGSDAMLGHHLGEAWRYAGELGDDPALRAELGRRAAAHLVPAAEAAIARSAVPAAVALFGQAAAMQPTGSTEHVDALVELGAALLTAGRLEAADAALADAEAAARAAGHAPARAHAGVLRLQVALQVDPAPALARIPVVTARAATAFGRGTTSSGCAASSTHARSGTGSPGAARRPERRGSGRRPMPARAATSGRCPTCSRGSPRRCSSGRNPSRARSRAASACARRRRAIRCGRRS